MDIMNCMYFLERLSFSQSVIHAVNTGQYLCSSVTIAATRLIYSSNGVNI